LAQLPGWTFMPQAEGHRATFWLTAATIDRAEFGRDRDAVIDALAASDIEARPVWKPMHLQPLYAGARVIGGNVSAGLFENGICLPSGSRMEDADIARVIERIRTNPIAVTA
jgi:dTDP-4-amino-4,6-dideoxygalactose transaminase